VPQRQQPQTRADLTTKILANRPGKVKTSTRKLLLISQVSHLQGTSSWRTPSPGECTRNREKISASTNRWPASAAGAFAGGRLLPPTQPRSSHAKFREQRSAEPRETREERYGCAERSAALGGGSRRSPAARGVGGGERRRSERQAFGDLGRRRSGSVGPRNETNRPGRTSGLGRVPTVSGPTGPGQAARRGSEGEEEGKADEKVRRRWRRRGRGAGWRSCWWTGSGT
jgi:hypothetical protein